MYFHWLIFSIIILLLAGCISQTEQHTKTPMAPAQDISGAEPRCESYHTRANNDYQLNGQTYKIVKDPNWLC